MQISIITSCTNRKAAKLSKLQFPVHRTWPSLRSAAEFWHEEVQSSLDRTALAPLAKDLYQGRSIAEVKRIQHSLGANTHVASAGLGLVRFDDRSINYDVTVADSRAPLGGLLTRLRATPSDWWLVLAEAGLGRGLISDQIRSTPGTVFLVAMPGTYLEMVKVDLLRASESDLAQLLLFTHPGVVGALPERLRQRVLPYDERLQAADAFAGTRSDFAQRALAHFCLKLEGHSLDFSASKTAVVQAMATLKQRPVPPRRRVSDAEVSSLLRKHWQHTQGSGTRLLRLLRDELGISCEQKRFQALWHEIRHSPDQRPKAIS